MIENNVKFHKMLYQVILSLYIDCLYKFVYISLFETHMDKTLKVKGEYNHSTKIRAKVCKTYVMYLVRH